MRVPRGAYALKSEDTTLDKIILYEYKVASTRILFNQTFTDVRNIDFNMYNINQSMPMNMLNDVRAAVSRVHG